MPRCACAVSDEVMFQDVHSKAWLHHSSPCLTALEGHSTDWNHAHADLFLSLPETSPTGHHWRLLFLTLSIPNRFGKENQYMHVLIMQPSIFLYSLPYMYATSKPLENMMKLSTGRKHAQIIPHPFQRRWTLWASLAHDRIKTSCSLQVGPLF